MLGNQARRCSRLASWFQDEHLRRHRVLHHILRPYFLRVFFLRKDIIHVSPNHCNYPTSVKPVLLNSWHLLSQGALQVLVLLLRKPFALQVLLIPFEPQSLLVALLRLLGVLLDVLLLFLQPAFLPLLDALLLSLQPICEPLPILLRGLLRIPLFCEPLLLRVLPSLPARPPKVWQQPLRLVAYEPLLRLMLWLFHFVS